MPGDTGPPLGNGRCPTCSARLAADKHGTCHGGFIFALADSAFAFACNTDGQESVASHCTVTYLRPVRAGERLLAMAAERHRAGRSGITDVRVTAGNEVVAEFRGHSRTTGARLRGAPDAS